MNAGDTYTKPENELSRCYIPRRYILLLFLNLSVVIIYIQRTALSTAILELDKEFNWDDETEGLILSSFYVGYITTQIIGGWLASRFGGKRVMGFSVVGASLCTLLLPFMQSPISIVICRIVTGITEGMTYPTIYHFLGTWFLESERSLVAVVVNTGPAIATTIVFGGSGLIMEILGWRSLFWISGVLGVYWGLGWYLFVLDKPTQNSQTCITINPYEQKLIEKEHLPILAHERPPTPWKKILCNIPVQALVINHFANTYIYYVSLSWLPTYLEDALGFKLNASSIISLLPYVAGATVSLIWSRISDYVIGKKIFSQTFVRKFSQCLGLGLSTLGLLLLSFLKVEPMVVVGIVVFTVGIAGICSASVAPNFIDLSKNFSGVLFGYSNTISTIPGIVGVYLSGWILQVSGNNWSLVFLVSAGLNVIAFGVCLLGISGEQQEWDKIAEKPNVLLNPS